MLQVDIPGGEPHRLLAVPVRGLQTLARRLPHQLRRHRGRDHARIRPQVTAGHQLDSSWASDGQQLHNSWTAAGLLLARFRVCLMGESQVGKTALVSQFQTSDFLNTYDASLGNQ